MSSAYDPDEAHIEASRAPLLDHLIELRSRLIWSTVAFFIAFVVCFVFSEDIYLFLVHP
ncbi:MAG TPA: twin-arginine translocase subunit TatC, partial [Caulobacteraceae bacterium]|nr:twin-arginine translocase subunit TatC [Caulobacteraceae bacterium]